MKIQSKNKYINIGGIDFLNQEIEGLYSYKEAMEYAKSTNHRLPTLEELKILSSNIEFIGDSIYAVNKEGITINPNNAIKLGLNGYKYTSGSELNYVNKYGYYWACTIRGALGEAYTLLIDKNADASLTSFDPRSYHSIILVKP